MIVRQSTLTTLASLCALVGLLALSDAPAPAALTHDYLFQFNEIPAGPGVTYPGLLTGDNDMTIDSGHVWIAEHISGTGSYRVDEFNGAKGEFVGELTHGDSTVSYRGIAVGHATGEGEVYVGEYRYSGETGPALSVYSESGSLQATWTGADTPGGTLGEGTWPGVAVDDSTSLSDWAAGDVYVAVPSQKVVDVFKPEAGGKEEYVTQLTGISPSEEFSSPSSVTVSAFNGDVVIEDGEGVDVFKPSALVGQYEFVGRLTPPDGSFQGSPRVAADGGNGNIYVSQENSVDEFDSAGAYIGRFTGVATPAGNFNVVSVGADPATHRVYVTDYRGEEGGLIDVFGPDIVIPDATTEPVSNVQPTSATLGGVVNPDGIPVSDCHFDYGTTVSYGQSVPCAQTLAQIGAGNAPVAVSADLSGLATGVYHFRLSASNANGTNTGSDQLFGPPRIVIESASSTNVTQTTTTLQAQVNPDALDTTYRFEYGTTTSYGTSVPIPDGDMGAGTSDQSVNANLSSLQAGVTYHYRVVAVNAASAVTGADHTFTTIPPAKINSVTISNLTATSATVQTRINPLGTDTTYHFEYGTSTSYGTSVPVPDGDLGTGMGDVTITQQLTGLRPNTTYHVRVAAQNTLGVARSGDHTFAYDTTGGGLPDNRAYEMVTPPSKNGALIGPVVLGILPQVSEDGSRLIADSIQCFAGAGSCVASRQSEGEPYLFTRTSGGWAATALAPSATQFDANSVWTVGANTGTALFSIPTPPVGEDDWYLRKSDGSFVDLGPETPGRAGTIGDRGLVAAADFSHIVWDSASVWPFDLSIGPTVYEYAGTGNAAPLLVGVTGGLGSTDLISTCGTDLGGGEQFPTQINGSMSADGRIVYFTTRACASGSGANAHTPVPASALYARIDESRTVPISGSPSADCTTFACKSAPAGDALFQGASADGSKVFFTSTQQLTDTASQDSQRGDSASNCSSTTGPNGCNLYEYDFANPAEYNLIDVSPGDTSGDGPRVQGVVTSSSDGSHVYFVAKGVLSTTANSQGETPHDGADNLYVFERDASHPGGHVVFIAVLPESDSPNWQDTASLANVTPDGRFLVFESHGTLTSDDVRRDGAERVFRYDARTGALVRISIGEGGFNDNGNTGTGDARIASAQFSTLSHAGPARLDPTMSHDGSYVFFQSPVALTPQALNDVSIDSNGGLAQNVYEYHDGHVYLISDGRDISEHNTLSSVELVGSDATGSNVFFTTTDQLVPQDTDTQRDYYDARICTTNDPCVAPPSPPLPPCLGEACHGTPTASPLVPSSPTATFNGLGNVTFQSSAPKKVATKKLTRCSKGRKRSHRKCVKAKAKKSKSHKGGK
jgi:hypothetical protein